MIYDINDFACLGENTQETHCRKVKTKKNVQELLYNIKNSAHLQTTASWIQTSYNDYMLLQNVS